MWHFITDLVKSGEKPEEVVLRALEDQTGFTGDLHAAFLICDVCLSV